MFLFYLTKIQPNRLNWIQSSYINYMQMLNVALDTFFCKMNILYLVMMDMNSPTYDRICYTTVWFMLVGLSNKPIINALYVISKVCKLHCLPQSGSYILLNVFYITCTCHSAKCQRPAFINIFFCEIRIGFWCFLGIPIIIIM
jgi:hypothetical protein